MSVLTYVMYVSTELRYVQNVSTDLLLRTAHQD